MIHAYRIQELKLEWERRHSRKLSWAELAKATGISPPTLSKLNDIHGYVTNTRYIASLCLFFGVKPSELMIEVKHPFDPPSPATPESLDKFAKYHDNLRKWEEEQVKVGKE